MAKWIEASLGDRCVRVEFGAIFSGVIASQSSGDRID